MKVFWGLIAILAIVTAMLLIGGGGRGAGAPSRDAAPSGVADDLRASNESDGIPGESIAAQPATSAPERDDQRASSPSPAEKAAAIDAAQAPESNDSPAAPGVESVASEPAPRSGNSAVAPNAPAVLTSPDLQGKSNIETELDALIKDLQESATQTPTDGEAPSLQSPKDDSAPADAGGERSAESKEPEGDETAPAEGAPVPAQEEKPAPKADPARPTTRPSKFEVREDGSILADDRFVIRGKGTKEDPYQVTWDMLVATSELYDPRRERLQLPERVKMLDGKYVTIVGYVTFPIVAESADEMLAMLNSWDGCCIGVPPTPYDAVEVRLRDAATAEQMLMNWGRITGRFKVEPYLAANWLLGLYLMEDAVLKAEGM